MATDSKDMTEGDGVDEDGSDLETEIAGIVEDLTKDAEDLGREDVADLVSRRFSDAGIVLDEASIEELVSEIVDQN